MVLKLRLISSQQATSPLQFRSLIKNRLFEWHWVVFKICLLLTAHLTENN